MRERVKSFSVNAIIRSCAGTSQRAQSFVAHIETLVPGSRPRALIAQSSAHSKRMAFSLACRRPVQSCSPVAMQTIDACSSIICVASCASRPWRQWGQTGASAEFAHKVCEQCAAVLHVSKFIRQHRLSGLRVLRLKVGLNIHSTQPDMPIRLGKHLSSTELQLHASV